MRSAILLVVLSVAVLGGCTSAYKTGQTPDDVYYSPARQHDEYVRVKDNEEPRYQSDDEYYDDRYLRMKVHNRVMWSDLDDYYFYNPRYSYSYYNSLNWNNPWSPYTYWNYYYNPYCSYRGAAYTGYSKVVYNHPRIFNLNTYNGNQLTNNNYTNPKGSGSFNSYGGGGGKQPRIIGGYTPSNSNSNSGAGNFLRNIFNGSSSNNSSSSPSSSSPSRSSSSSSSSSGSSGGSAPVRRF